MKITAKNLNEKWDEIKHLMPKSLTETAAGKLEFAELYDDLDSDTREEYDIWLKKVNDVLEKSDKPTDKTKPSPEPKKKPKSEDLGKKEKPQKKVKKDTKDKPTKTPKTPKAKKEKKEPKPRVAEAEPWQYTLRRFAAMCGKERTVTGIRKFVREIQANFSAKLGKKTPHIDLIRQIQEKLLPKANSKEKKIELPQWDDLKKQCQQAAREKIVSRTIAKPEIKSAALSGLKKKRKSSKRRKRSCR